MDVSLAKNTVRTALRAHEQPRPRYRMVMGTALSAVAAGNAAVIVWLWLYGGGVSGVHGVGDLLTSLGRITGLLSAYSALIQVLLLARLPWLERLAGFDRLTVWHRLNGKICLLLVLAHTVLITIGYAANDRISIPAEVSALLRTYPGMIAATVGTALMVGVVVTSLVIVRRRLHYEAWYAVHLLAYAAIALAWVHQIPTGNDLTANVAASSYWNALYIVTIVLLLLFRIAAPAFQAFRHQLRVAEVTVEGPGVVTLRISGRRLDRLNAHAGQFFLWRFLTPGRWWASHPFSLSAVPDGRSLRITVKQVGDFTGQIAAIAPGTRVVAEGPFGVFTGAVRRRERSALIAGGIGITPLRALLEELPGDVALIYRVIREDEVIFREELEALAQRRGAALHYAIGDHNSPEGSQLLSPEHLRRLLPDIAERDIYVCGPPAMMRAVERNLRTPASGSPGVPARQIHTERFAL